MTYDGSPTTTAAMFGELKQILSGMAKRDSDPPPSPPRCSSGGEDGAEPCEVPEEDLRL